jgi:hypothetical protein
VHRFLRTICGLVALAGLAVLTIAETASPARAQGAAAAQTGQPAATKRNYKDNGEYDLYMAAFKDAQNPAKQIQDLDTWAQKYPTSDYKDVRTGMLVQAYSQLNPPKPDKVLEYAGQLITKDLKTVFDDPRDGQRQILQFFYATTAAAGLAGSSFFPNPTPAEVELGRTAAKRLKEEAATFFVAANKPPATSDADWTKTRATLDQAADHTLLVLTIYPAEAVMAPGNTARTPAQCKDVAEPAYRKALTEYPNNAYVSYKLAQALQCQQKESPEKVFGAIYEYERAAVIDPKLGGAQPDPKVVPAYADKAYIGIHGSADGLDQLKELVKQSPLPPDGFKIKTAAEVAAEKQAEFAKDHPYLDMWYRIKNALTDPADPDYFETKLKDTAGPKLRGVVVDGACRGKEITVAFPIPGQAGPLVPEVTLKFEAPLSGKPDANAEITFEGAVATAFTKDPFMLTMDIEKSKVDGLTTSPCTPGPARKGAPPAPKKK